MYACISLNKLFRLPKQLFKCNFTDVLRCKVGVLNFERGHQLHWFYVQQWLWHAEVEFMCKPIDVFMLGCSCSRWNFQTLDFFE